MIGGWQVDIDHLDGSELLQHGTGRQAWGQMTQSRTQGDLQAVGEEGDEDVGFDSVLELMKDGTQSQIVFEGFEGGLNFHQLDVKLPELGGIPSAKIGVQKVTAFAAADLTEFVLAKPCLHGAGNPDGFNPFFCRWLRNCLKTARFSRTARPLA